ncbi:MAG TPA: glyoxylate/hydroxypyruvate reductase A [Rubrivivax sp.]|nr:glyoxylate/hydroxypyruvate reductase A [Rubrivivax sp.]
MNVLLCGDIDTAELASWRAALAAAMPEASWLDGEKALEKAMAVEAAVVANPQPGSLSGFPNLRLIQSLWAGVDRLLADRSLPPNVPIARMVDPAMTAAMVQTALWAVLSLHRGFFDYARQQLKAQWLPHPQRRADEVQVLVLGRGEMGRATASRLAEHGYQVQSWSRASSGAEPLRALLPSAEIVINLLPLTDATRGLLDAPFFAALPPGAALVNLARGAHVVEPDLLAALDSGALRHAVLDVFATEPLPTGHRFWQHPAVTVLPHAAAMTDPRSAAAVVAANLRSLRDGAPLSHLVDRTLGY